jgi:cyclopropane fatty-acyl-phospholipid synthase-like methyltransferase
MMPVSGSPEIVRHSVAYIATGEDAMAVAYAGCTRCDSFGSDYDRTLMAWWNNFERAWPRFESKYGKRVYRTWKYCLRCCAGFFRFRQGQLRQLVLSKRGRGGVYRSVR